MCHMDHVVKPAEDSEILAVGENCPIAMCKIGNHILTLQGHPEFSTSYAKDLLDLRRDTLGEKVYRHSIESLQMSADQELMADIFSDFLMDNL